MTKVRVCANCRNTEAATGHKLQACGSCRKRKAKEVAYYCGRACQKLDWKKNGHRIVCFGPAFEHEPIYAEGEWVEEARAMTEDHSVHLGKLQLITWDCVDEEDGLALGWGGVVVEEVESLKHKFEVCLGGSLEKLFEYNDTSFRWTCCGFDASTGTHGCDHHGDPKAVRPCGCDFCSAGRPVPGSIFNRVKQEKMGLALRKGPDPRGRTMAGELNMIMRNVLGMEC